MSRPLCQHCRKKSICRPRGLCWTCYYSPGVRDRFPSTSKYARRGVGSQGLHVLPEPTSEPPGTEAKVLVLVSRALRGEELFHPEDAAMPAPVPWQLPVCHLHLSEPERRRGIADDTHQTLNIRTE